MIIKGTNARAAHSSLRSFPIMRMNGLVLVAMSGVMFSIISLLADYCISQGVSTFTLQMVRGAFMVVIPGFLLSVCIPYEGPLSHHILGSNWNIFGLGMLRGLFGFGAIGCFYLSLQYLSLSSASVIFFSLPVHTGSFLD